MPVTAATSIPTMSFSHASMRVTDRTPSGFVADLLVNDRVIATGSAETVRETVSLLRGLNPGESVHGEIDGELVALTAHVGVGGIL